MTSIPRLGLALFALAISAGARADVYDCFPSCLAEAPRAGAVANLCGHRTVREAYRIDAKLKPAKQLYGLVTNPTGFALQQVNDHIVEIPGWVPFALDPRGALRGWVMKKVRDEAKEPVGVRNDCAAEIAEEDEALPDAAAESRRED